MAIYIWRWKILVIGLAALGFALFAANVIPSFSPSYASEGSVADVKKDLQSKIDGVNHKLDATNDKITAMAAQLHESQIRQLNTDLIDARRYQCRAINSQDKTSLPFWTGRLQDLKLSFYQLTGSTWSELDCNSF